METSIEKRVAELENLVFLSKNVLSFDEASKFLNLSKSYLYKLTSGNLIPHYKPQGKMLYFEKAELEAYVKEQGLQEHIRFVGFRTDLHEILQASDCFVLSSFREGLSVALMEAMAEGLPVVCGRIRGNVDLIKEGKGGILVSPGNKEDYEAAFRKLYEMKYKELTDFQRMGHINAENVKSFGRSAVERLMENVYLW